MKQIDFSSVYLLIIFVLPGFFSYLVSTTLYKHGSKDSEIEVIYKSVLYSGSIYLILYILGDSLGIWMIKYVEEFSIETMFIITGVMQLMGNSPSIHSKRI